MQNALENILLILHMFIYLSHITTECQKRLFEIILIVDDVKWNYEIVLELGSAQLWVLVLEKYLCIGKLHFSIELLLGSDLIIIRLKNTVEAVYMLSRLYLFYLCFGKLVDFKKLVYLLVKPIENTLHLNFTLF